MNTPTGFGMRLPATESLTVPELTAEEIRRARLAVAANANSIEDALRLLDMLGIGETA